MAEAIINNGPSQEKLLKLTRFLKPIRIGEIVLKTSRYPEMKAWYQAVLGVETFFESKLKAASSLGTKPGELKPAGNVIQLCFFRVHMEYPYGQMVVLFHVSGIGDRPTNDPGLHHMQFRHASFEDTIVRYERLCSAGIKPFRTATHGPFTSFYYHDPDGNSVELFGSNFDTEEEYLGYFKTESFAENHAGIDVDPEEFVRRFRSDAPQSNLLKFSV